MAHPIRFLRVARDEVDQAFKWYEQKRPGLGMEFLEAIEQMLERIEERPASFPLGVTQQ